MLLRQLHLGNGGRLHAALAHLVIIIILHVVRLHCLIWLIALRGLLLNIIVLQVRILYYYLFAFLLNDLLLRFLLRLRLILQLHTVEASVPFLLLHGDTLFLLWRTLIQVLVVIFVV